MTAAEAVHVLESRLALFPDIQTQEALEIVRGKVIPKPRKPRATKACPIAKAALKACSGIGIGINEEAAYLDTFGPAGSPEREAQRIRLRSLPVYSQFSYEGMPAKTAKDPGAARMFLEARMAQFELDDEADRLAKVRQRVYRETRTLREWATRNRPESERYRWYSDKPTAQWPREEIAA